MHQYNFVTLTNKYTKTFLPAIKSIKTNPPTKVMPTNSNQQTYKHKLTNKYTDTPTAASNHSC